VWKSSTADLLEDPHQPLQPALGVHPDPDPSRLWRQAAEHDTLFLVQGGRFQRAGLGLDMRLR
jgi:hypothetical protein